MLQHTCTCSDLHGSRPAATSGPQVNATCHTFIFALQADDELMKNAVPHHVVDRLGTCNCAMACSEMLAPLRP